MDVPLIYLGEIFLLSTTEILHYFVYFLWELGGKFCHQDNRVYNFNHWIFWEYFFEMSAHSVNFLNNYSWIHHFWWIFYSNLKLFWPIVFAIGTTDKSKQIIFTLWAKNVIFCPKFFLFKIPYNLKTVGIFCKFPL